MPDRNNRVSYEIWSNIHYGYVGTEARFDSWDLRASANLADLAGQFKTDAGDDLAVRIGIELRRKYAPDALVPEHLHQAIVDNIGGFTATGKAMTCATPLSGC